MKKFLFSIAALALAASASAVDLNYNTADAQEEVNKFAYTVTPEEGDVESLDKVEIRFTYSGWSNIKILDKSAITLTLNGEPLTCKAAEPFSGKKDRIVVTNTSSDKSASGDYVITIPAGTFRADVKGFEADDSEKNPEAIVLRYRVKSATPDPGTDPGTGGEVTGPWGYQATPTPGVVKELSEIKVVFPNWESLDVNSEDDITLTCDGTPVATTLSAQDTGFTLTIDTPATKAGKYVVSVGAWALTGYKDLTDDGYQTIEDCEAFTIDYTIEGEAPAGLSFKATAEPAETAALLSLDKVTVTFPDLDTVTVLENGLQVFVGEMIIDADKYSASAEGNVVTVNFTEAITGPTSVMITFLGDGLNGKKGDLSGSNSDAVFIYYSLLRKVKYDLTLDLSGVTKKNDKGEISAEKQLTSFFFSSEGAGLVAAAGSEANVTIKQVNGDFEASAHLSKGYGIGQNQTFFCADFGREPQYNGEYVITVAEGAFGDEQWSLNPETGHSNPEIIINFTLVDGLEEDLNTIAATVTPEEGAYKTFDEIATITLTFAEEMTPVEEAGATLIAEDGTRHYNETAFFTKVENGYAVTFPAPAQISANDVFMFNVQPGQFKNAAGRGNAEISFIYTVEQSSGVAVIEMINEDAEVYTTDGRRVSGKIFAPGLYIVNGVKIAVK